MHFNTFQLGQQQLLVEWQNYWTNNFGGTCKSVPCHTLILHPLCHPLLNAILVSMSTVFAIQKLLRSGNIDICAARLEAGALTTDSLLCCTSRSARDFAESSSEIHETSYHHAQDYFSRIFLQHRHRRIFRRCWSCRFFLPFYADILATAPLHGGPKNLNG